MGRLAAAEPRRATDSAQAAAAAAAASSSISILPNAAIHTATRTSSSAQDGRSPAGTHSTIRLPDARGSAPIRRHVAVLAPPSTRHARAFVATPCLRAIAT